MFMNLANTYHHQQFLHYVTAHHQILLILKFRHQLHMLQRIFLPDQNFIRASVTELESVS